MLKAWIDQWAHPQQLAGVEVYSHPEGDRLNYMVLSRTKNEVNITDQGSDIPSWPILQERLDPAIPIVLNYNVKTVLHRVLDQPIQNLETAFQQILPNANVQDFVAQAQSNAVAFTRKAPLETYLQEIKAQGFQVLDCRLGVLSVGPLFPLLKDYPSLQTASYQIEKGEQSFQKINPKLPEIAQEIIIANQSLSGNHSLAFTCAFLTLNTYATTPLKPLLQTREDWTFTQLFQPLKWAVLGTLFFAAALSYWGWQSNQQQVGELQAFLGFHSSMLAKLDTFQTLQVAQDRFGGLQGGSTISHYADLIAASVPEGIQLKRLQLFPELKQRTYQDGEMIPEFEEGTILLSGTLEKSEPFNSWISQLENKDWIQKIQITKFDSSVMSSSFEIIIHH